MLLDQISRATKTFQPTSVREVLGLRIAAKLNDLEHLYFYLRLSNRFNEQLLVEQLRKLIGAGLTCAQVAEAFRKTLNN
jgi:hypothetical protein